MTWYHRAPHAGWYVVLTIALCVLAVCWAEHRMREANRLASQARRTIEMLNRGRWVQLDSGDVVIRRKVGR